MDFARRQPRSRTDYCSACLRTDSLDCYRKSTVLETDSADSIETTVTARIGSSSSEAVVPVR